MEDINIGELDPENGTVECTFVYAGVTHTRAVNAVFRDGQYDKEATAARVEEVGLGVREKIDLGVITNAPPPEPEPPVEAE